MNSLIMASRCVRDGYRPFSSSAFVFKGYNRNQVVILDGIDPEHLAKFEKIVAKIAHDALVENSKETKFSVDLNQLQEMFGGSSSQNPSIPSSSSYPSGTQHGSSQIVNSNISTTTKNEYNFSFGGSSINPLKGMRMPSGSGDMSGLARMAIGVTSLAVGALAVNKLGENVSIAADQGKHRAFLDAFSGSLKVSRNVALQSNNGAKIALVEDYIEVGEKASKILTRATNNRKQNVAIIGTVAASAVLGFAGAVISIPALVGLGVFGAGASILGGAYKFGTSHRIKALQIKDAEKMKDKILSMVVIKEVPSQTEFRSLPQQQQQLVNVGGKRRYSTASRPQQIVVGQIMMRQNVVTMVVRRLCIFIK